MAKKLKPDSGRTVRAEIPPPAHPLPPIPSLSEQKGSAMKDTFETISATFTPAAFEKFFASSKEQMEKFSVSGFKSYEEFSKFSKENLDAAVAATTIAAKGYENLGKAWMTLMQESMEQGAQTAKALLGAKTLREAVDLQTDYAKTSFDKLVAEGTKMSEIGLKVANEALEPISARVNVAVEKLLKPAAAA